VALGLFLSLGSLGLLGGLAACGGGPQGRPTLPPPEYEEPAQPTPTPSAAASAPANPQ
jgi:hypothetical protein